MPRGFQIPVIIFGRIKNAPELGHKVQAIRSLLLKNQQKIWNIQLLFVLLQRERNLFRMEASVGSASKAIKAEFLFSVRQRLLQRHTHL